MLRPILFAVVTACRLVWQRDSWNYDTDSAVISVFASPASQLRRCASPAIAIQSKNCTASVAVAMDSYTTATGLYSLEKSLKPCLDCSSCPWRVATHCQQMEPLLALCLFPGLSHSSLSLHVLCNALPIGCKAELCNYRQRYHPPSLLLYL